MRMRNLGRDELKKLRADAGGFGAPWAASAYDLMIEEEWLLVDFWILHYVDSGASYSNAIAHIHNNNQRQWSVLDRVCKCCDSCKKPLPKDVETVASLLIYDKLRRLE